MKKTIAAFLVAFAASSAVPAFAAEQPAQPAAQHKMMRHHHKAAGKHSHDMAMKPMIAVEKLPASVQSYIKANEKMHREMMVNYTGNADIDFVRGMIAHHKGAVAMAEVELKYGKDAEMRNLAKEIIAAQKKEIHQMEKWLKTAHHEMKQQAKAEHKAAKKQAEMKAAAAKK